MVLPRRHFLHSAGSALLACGIVGCGSSRNPYRLLDSREAATLSALCEQIVPTDDTPGAAWAHVVKFIDRQLVYHYRTLRPVYRDGLAALDRVSVERNRAHYDELPLAAQTAMTAQLEQGAIDSSVWPADAQRGFFRMVRDHTMQGYYGDPRHGGNRDHAGWRTLGVPYPPVRGRDDYRFPKERTTAADAGSPEKAVGR